MDLLIDTHVLVWVSEGDKLTRKAADALEDPDNRLFVSEVTAWEFADLRARGRLPAAVTLAPILQALACEVLPLPASLWTLAADLPQHHGDPVDRMLVAHTIDAGLTLITADRTIPRYPIRTLW